MLKPCFLIAIAFVLGASVSAAMPPPQASTVLHGDAGWRPSPMTATPPTDTITSNVVDTANEILNALASKDYLAAVGLALILAVAFFRWLLPKLHDKVGAFFRTDIGGTTLVVGAAMIGSLATSLIAHKTGLRTILDGLIVSCMASGGYNLFKSYAKHFYGTPSTPTTTESK